jgi:hypothetical protein
MGIMSRFRALQRAAKQRATIRRVEQMQNAEANLALDDQQFHRLSDRATVQLLEKRLGLGGKGSGYRASFHEEGDDDD